MDTGRYPDTDDSAPSGVLDTVIRVRKPDYGLQLDDSKVWRVVGTVAEPTWPGQPALELAITGRSPRDDEDRAGYERLLEELRAGFTLVPHSRDTPAADEPAQSFDPVLDKGLLFEARVVSQADDVDGLVSATGEPAFDAVLSVHPFRNVVPGHPDVWKAGDSSNGWIYVGVGTGRLSSGKSHKDAGPGQTSAPIAASTLRVYALHHVAATYQFIGNHQYKQTG